MGESDATRLWEPTPERVKQSNLACFMAQVKSQWDATVEDFPGLFQWSVDNPEQFWQTLWHYAHVKGQMGETVLADAGQMPGARWFPEARLNFAQNLLRRVDDSDAIVFWGEDQVKRSISYRDLYNQVSQLSQALKTLGVGPGDRVAGFMPNMPETVIAMLATASLGGVWSSCSPDFGVRGVLDRFGQIEPKVLISADGYFYNGKRHDSLAKLRDIVAELPGLQRVLVVPYTQASPDLAGLDLAGMWSDVLRAHLPGPIDYEMVPFDHPLYIMYSSGTTGVPKCIVHGVGGTLLQHLKEHLLHTDVTPQDQVFYFTTCGWMMWNWVVSTLATEATLMLYDGSPFYPDGNILFDYAEQARITVFGTSAKFIDAVNKAGLKPKETHDLSQLRAILSTGSPLLPESFDFVYRDIKADLQLSSISGGTDIISCFALGCPILPVYRGELQCRGLGMRVEVWNDEGQPVQGEKGELVCSAPFPCMPIYFWNDEDGAKYRAAYFERFPGVWCHGDYVELTEHDGLVIYGRSDAVLNPGGVRIGTAEIYRQVEQLPEVLESLVIGQDWEGDVRVVLFVRLQEGHQLDEALIKKIKTQIRQNCTPRHVPAKVLEVNDIPRTKSGKIVELAVRHVVHGREVKNVEALANPEALAEFKGREELSGS